MGLDAAGTVEFELLADPDVLYHLYRADTIASMLAGNWTHKLCDLKNGSTTLAWTPVDATTVRWTPVFAGLMYEGYWVVVAEKTALEGSYGTMSSGSPRPPDGDGQGSEGTFGCP
jgi:hypothetical protein